MAGGGSHGSGRVEYAAYLQSRHGSYLGDSAIYSMDLNMTQAINMATEVNPFEDFNLADPTTEFGLMDAALVTYASAYANFDDSFIADELNVAIAEIDADIANTTLPKHRANYRDLGLCLSSALPNSEALIMAERTRTVAKLEASLRTQFINMKAAALDKSLHYGVEVARMRIVAEHDFNSDQIDLLLRYAEWDMNAILKGGQLISSISGSSIVPDKPSRAQSALSGALAGAAAGATLGPEGAIIGGVLGAAGGYLSSK